MSNGGKRTEWNITLLGGRELRGKQRLDHDIFSVSVIGGMDLDLGQAEIAAPEVTITKVSLIGGVDATTPDNARVEVSGFNLIGGRQINVATPAPGAPVLRIRAFSILGGVKINSR